MDPRILRHDELIMLFLVLKLMVYVMFGFIIDLEIEILRAILKNQREILQLVSS